MVDPEFIDVTILSNDDDTVGAVMLSDEKKMDYRGTKVNAEYLRTVLNLADEMGWDDLWIGVSGDDELVLFEPAGDEHGPGTIALAPLLPPDEGEDDE